MNTELTGVKFEGFSDRATAWIVCIVCFDSYNENKPSIFTK